MNAATCSARVASATASRRAGSQACSCRRTVGSGPCRCSVAARLPVTRRRARYRSTLRSDTPNRSAACDWGSPASTAATTRSRKSIEYALTPGDILPPTASVNQPAHRCQVDDHGDVLVAAVGVSPHVLGDPDDRHAVEPAGVVDQEALAFGQDGVVGGVPGTPEALGDAGD